MVDRAALIGVFADYAKTIARRYDIGDVLYRLTDQVVEVLGCDGAGVSVVDAADSLRFVTATDDRIVRIDEAQIDLGEGPCQQAHRTGEVVIARDLTAEGRWPGYTAQALEQGGRAVLGIPMAVDDRQVGALNVYNRRRRDWSDEDVRIAVLLADMATGYILNAMALDESQRTTQQLQHALQSRVVVEQAKGVLVERHQIDAADAFERLRGHSRQHRRRIHDIARAVVARELEL